MRNDGSDDTGHTGHTGPNDDTGSEGWFWGQLLALLLLGGGGIAALTLWTTSAAALAALPTRYAYEALWPRQPVDAATLSAWRTALTVLAALGGAGLVWAGARVSGRRRWAGLLAEIRYWLRTSGAVWRSLRPGQRRLAGLLLLVLSAARVWFSLLAQPYDDAVSFELYVWGTPWVVVAGNYNLPNNHLLPNACAWLLARLWPDFWWSMRLPVLLASTAATLAWFRLLLRRAGFGVALSVVMWFGFYRWGWYYAAVGRGYALLGGLGAVAVAALLVLQQPPAPGPPPARRQLAWLGLVLGGSLGLFAVPTHGLLLASVYGWLALRALLPIGQQSDKLIEIPARLRVRALSELVLAAGLTLLGTALLYAPVLLLSGSAALLRNPYVAAMSWADFWTTLPAALTSRHRLVGIPLTVLGLVGAGALWRAARAGRLPAWLASASRELVPLAAWLLVAPYALALLTRRQFPERTLFYKEQLLFLLVALLVAWARTRWPGRNLRRALWGLSLVFALTQLADLLWLERLARQHYRWEQAARTVAWLARQPPAPVLVPRNLYDRLLLRFYASQLAGGRRWQIDDYPRPGVRYAYFVCQPGAPLPPNTLPARRVAAASTALLDVYALVPPASISAASPSVIPAR